MVLLWRVVRVDIYTVSSSLNADGSQSNPDLVAHTGDVVKWFYYGTRSCSLPSATRQRH